MKELLRTAHFCTVILYLNYKTWFSRRAVWLALTSFPRNRIRTVLLCALRIPATIQSRIPSQESVLPKKIASAVFLVQKILQDFLASARFWKALWNIFQTEYLYSVNRKTPHFSRNLP